MKQILITGGSGLVGTSLTRRLKAQGYKVVFLGRQSRRGLRGIDKFEWDLKRGSIDAKAFEGTEIVLNLAGANVTENRWSKARKKEIYSSRVEGTRLLVEGIKKYGRSVKTLISASATGYYGDRDDEILYEESYPGKDFLADTCAEWEKEALKIKTELPSIRVSILRIGLVLSTRGGYFQKVKGPIKMWLGAAPFPGTQFQSWVHMEDLCQMFRYIIENEEVNGVFNAVAPEPVSADDMIANIASRCRKPYFLPPIPKWLLGLLFGELGSYLSSSQYVSCEKITQAGFTFKYADLNSALNNLILE